MSSYFFFFFNEGFPKKQLKQKRIGASLSVGGCTPLLIVLVFHKRVFVIYRYILINREKNEKYMYVHFLKVILPMQAPRER